MSEPLNSGDVSTRLHQIAIMAREHPERAFRSIHHVIDIDWLREAHRRTRKDGAVGIDGQTAADYAANLDENLQSLLDRFKSGSYRAPAVSASTVCAYTPTRHACFASSDQACSPGTRGRARDERPSTSGQLVETSPGHATC